MTRAELEYELTKTVAIRMIGWDIGNCIVKAKEWAPKVIAAFPELFPDEKIQPKEEDSKTVTTTMTHKTPGPHTVNLPPNVKTRSVGRRP